MREQRLPAAAPVVRPPVPLRVWEKGRGRAASVAYLVHAEAPRRMFDYCSTALPKIIALLREPIARYESQFQMRQAQDAGLHS